MGTCSRGALDASQSFPKGAEGEIFLLQASETEADNDPSSSCTEESGMKRCNQDGKKNGDRSRGESILTTSEFLVAAAPGVMLDISLSLRHVGNIHLTLCLVNYSV